MNEALRVGHETRQRRGGVRALGVVAHFGARHCTVVEDDELAQAFVASFEVESAGEECLEASVEALDGASGCRMRGDLHGRP